MFVNIWTHYIYYGLAMFICLHFPFTRIKTLTPNCSLHGTKDAENIRITLHNDLQIPFITEEIKRYSTLYYNRLIGDENSYVTELSNPLNVRRRLKRQWPSDLKVQRQEEE
jgi:hypothetical protein